MTHLRRGTLGLGLGLVIFLGINGQSLGQEAPKLEEIVVTAERREESLQTTPIAVTAFSAETIDLRQITDTIELDRHVPNLFLTEATANPNTLALSLRGASEGTGGLSVSESPVGIYVDDVYHSRPAGANFQFTDIERIEVLRGPQGTLFGRNTLSGAINIITRKPGDDIWADATVGYGSRDEVEAKGSIGGPLVEGSMGASAALTFREGNGFLFNRATGQEVGDYKNLAGRLSFTFYGNENFDAFLSLYAAKDETDGYVPVPIAYDVPNPTTDDAIFLSGDMYTTQTPTPTLGDTDQWGVTLDLKYSWGDTSLRSITGYVAVDDEFRADFTGGIEVGPGQFIAGFDRDSDSFNDQFSQEIQLSGVALDSRLDWIIGAYYLREDNSQIIQDILGGATSVLPTTFDLKTDSFAVFSQVNYRWTEQLSVIAGIRWSEDQKKLNATIQDGFAFPFQLATVDLDETFGSWVPRFGIEYQRNPETLFYATVARGFKAGGFNGIAVANPLIVRTPYDEQTVWSYEGGIKTDLFDNRFRVNAAIFWADYDAIQQVANIDPVTFSFATQNVGDGRVYGLELEMTAVVAEGLTVYGQLALMGNKYGTLTPNASAAVNNAESFPNTPSATGQIGFDYNTPINIAGGLSLFVGGDFSYDGDRFASVDNTLKTEEQLRLAGYVGIADEDNNWQLRISGRNLTNEKEVLGFTTVSAGGVVSEPRRLILELTVKY